MLNPEQNQEEVINLISEEQTKEGGWQYST